MHIFHLIYYYYGQFTVLTAAMFVKSGICGHYVLNGVCLGTTYPSFAWLSQLICRELTKNSKVLNFRFGKENQVASQ